MQAEDITRIIGLVAPYTMTDAVRITGLISETERVALSGIPGDFVECGVWRGGSMMAIALVLQHLGITDRDLYMFDTYTGMTEPEPVDVDLHGRAAMDPKAGGFDPAGCTASLAMVQANMSTMGYPPENLRYVKGDVMETLPVQAPERIALLHLDTDWYKSTRHELDQLFPRVEPGGCIVIDDYGHWAGARKATDEYLAIHAPELKPVPCGYSAVILRKP